MKDWLGISIGAILLGVGLLYAYHVHAANVAAANSSSNYLASQGLINNPFQDMSLYGSTQTTVDPLTGELMVSAGSINFNSLFQPQQIAGTATGTSTVT